MLDTADMYGHGDNETLVGKAIAGKRDRVFLATKFGIVRERGNPAKREISGRPEHVRAACEASLRRLNAGHIDLYYQHRVDHDVPIEETVGAMAELVARGQGSLSSGSRKQVPRRCAGRHASIPSPRCRTSGRSGRAISSETDSLRPPVSVVPESSPTARSDADFSPGR